MKIKILGTRGEVKKFIFNSFLHSGVLIDDILLLDIGERQYLEYNPFSIFITHLHKDHAFFVNEKVKINIPIYAPEMSKNVQVAVINKPIEIKGYLITPLPTIHSLYLKSQAYLIEKGKIKILYTGDLIGFKKGYGKFLKNLDLVITEASFLKRGGMIRKDKNGHRFSGHTGVPNLIQLFKPITSRIIFTHFGSWFYRNPKDAREKLKELGEKNNLKAYVADDGFDLELL